MASDEIRKLRFLWLENVACCVVSFSTKPSIRQGRWPHLTAEGLTDSLDLLRNRRSRWKTPTSEGKRTGLGTETEDLGVKDTDDDRLEKIDELDDVIELTRNREGGVLGRPLYQ